MTKDEEIIYANAIDKIDEYARRMKNEDAIKISEAMWDNFRTKPIDFGDMLEDLAAIKENLSK